MPAHAQSDVANGDLDGEALELHRFFCCVSFVVVVFFFKKSRKQDKSLFQINVRCATIAEGGQREAKVRQQRTELSLVEE